MSVTAMVEYIKYIIPNETCMFLECEDNTQATMALYVFVPGGSYPIFACGPEHAVALQNAAPDGVDVVIMELKK